MNRVRISPQQSGAKGWSHRVVVGVAAAAASLVQVSVFGPPTAHAVTPPDSCFGFSVNAIFTYYDNEGNVPTNPACPRDVDIPASIAGGTVRFISPSAFDNKNITSVTFPNTLVTIGDHAFSNNHITSVDIPSSVTSIFGSAFDNNQISSLTITPNTTRIDGNAFSNNRLTSATMYAGVQYGEAIFDRNLLTSVDIQPGVTSIPRGMFSNNNLTSVALPAGLQTIGDHAFQLNQLTTLVLPNSVTSINPGSFYGNSLTSLTLSSGLTSLPENVFTGNLLTSVNVPASITSLDPSAFSFQGSTRAADLWMNVPLGAGGAAADNAEFLSEINNIWFVQLYTPGYANPGGLTDNTNAITDFDFTGDGVNDPVSIGGNIVDPAPVQLNYLDTAGSTVSPSQQRVGTLTGGDTVSRYMVMDVQRDVFSPLVYFKVGQNVTFTPPAVSGYVTPASVGRVLGASTVVDFVYGAVSASGASTTTSGGGVGVKLAATGQVVWQAIAVAGALLGAGILVVLVSLRKKLKA